MGKPIATLSRPIFGPNGVIDLEVIREGMTKEEIIQRFPSYHTSGKYEYNRTALIRAIFQEAIQEVKDGKKRERKNVRGFTWYERCLYTLTKVMGETKLKSVARTIDIAWRELAEQDIGVYSLLNVYSEKEDLYRVKVSENSPFPGVVVIVEKADWFDVLYDIADTWRITLCCTGGKPSKVAAMKFLEDLESLGVDMTQDFTIFSMMDYDPEGWNIPTMFIDHLSLGISGDINLIRLGLLRDQLGENVIKYTAVPYAPDAKTSEGRKCAETIYNQFIEETGGLFIPGDDDEPIPAKIELDLFEPSQIREWIITGLGEHLDGFPYQEQRLRRIFDLCYDRAVKKIKESIEQGIETLYQSYFEEIAKEINAQRAWYYDGTAEEAERIEEIDDEIECINSEHRSRFREDARELLEELERLQSQIREIEVSYEQRAQEGTKDLRDEKEELEDEIENHKETVSARIGRLDILREDLEGESEEDEERAIEEFETDLPSAYDLMAEIEYDGGWRSWLEDLGYIPIGGDYLVEDARQHKQFSWQADWRMQADITERLFEELDGEGIKLEGPDEEPEDMIERTIGGAAP